MILRAYIDKMAFGPGKPVVASLIAMVLIVLMSASFSLALEGYSFGGGSSGVGGYSVGGSRVSPLVNSSVGALNAPPTSMQSGLVARPTMQKYYERNLGITGNIAGGREFRGSVPYSATSDFQAPLGSAQINSFIRGSTRTPYRMLSEGRSLPYYLPSKTVTSIRRGDESGLKSPVIIPQNQRPVYKYPTTEPKTISPLAIEQPMLGKRRPFAFDSDEMAIKLAKKAKKDNLQIVDEMLYDQDRAAEVKEMLREFGEQESKKFEAEVLRELQMKKSELEESDLPFFGKDAITGEVGERPGIKVETKKKSLEQETEELTKFIEEELGITPRKSTDEITKMLKEMEDLPVEAKTEQDAPKPTFQEQLNEMVPVDHKRAMELLGEHKDFASLARMKFATYRRLAAEFMKRGQYYDARDTWKLAEIWIANHPDAAMGKGTALFAAGEYRSSSYYIEVALAYSYVYAKQKSDLFRFVDEATLKNQISELTRLHKYSKSYKLGFLLAYLNYQENKLEKAVEYLLAIKPEMNQSQGYQNLRKAIEMAIAQEGDK